MSVDQYLRKFSLIVGPDSGEARDLSDLRCYFSVRRGDNETPNTADIRVTNPAPATVQQAMSSEFTRVVLQAGYEGNFGAIFDGQIKQTRYGRISSTETYLDIHAADGDRAYNYSTMALSLAAGENGQRRQLDAVLGSMASFAVFQGYVPPDLPDNPLPRGKVMFGQCADELRIMARNSLTNWSIQNGKLQLVPETAYLPGDVPEINASTGMIGIPEQTQNGIKVRTLLNPALKIGQVIRLNNASIQTYRRPISLGATVQNDTFDIRNPINPDGLYYVMVADYYGDSRGDSWYSDLTCLSVDATIDPEYLKTQPVGVPVVSAIKRRG